MPAMLASTLGAQGQHRDDCQTKYHKAWWTQWAGYCNAEGHLLKNDMLGMADSARDLPNQVRGIW